MIKSPKESYEVLNKIDILYTDEEEYTLTDLLFLYRCHMGNYFDWWRLRKGQRLRSNSLQA